MRPVASVRIGAKEVAGRGDVRPVNEELERHPLKNLPGWAPLEESAAVVQAGRVRYSRGGTAEKAQGSSARRRVKAGVIIG